MKSRASASRGFTIIELMIVLAIVGILTSIGAYSYMAQIRQIKLQNDVRQVSQTIQVARMRTMATGMAHGIVIYTYTGDNSQEHTGYFIFVDCNGDEQFTDNDTDPGNNAPVATAEACAASTTKDPRMLGDNIHELDDFNQFVTLPNDLNYIVFNNLGQAVQGATPVFGPIVFQGPPKNNLVNQMAIQMSASGLTEVMPSQVVEY